MCVLSVYVQCQFTKPVVNSRSRGLLHAGNEKFGRFIAKKEAARCSLREAISLYALLLLKCIQKLHVNFSCTNNISFLFQSKCFCY